MRFTPFAIAAALLACGVAHAAPPAPAQGSYQFDSGSSSVKAPHVHRKKTVRKASARSRLAAQAMRDGSGRQ
ncbi:hypothetical protein GN316_07510 [Xylophilus sp. Kf1]|nr:hypothetical protein [Xylophilus sp. Kf1]